MFQKRQAARKKFGKRDPASLSKFDVDLPSMELERARLFSEFGSSWVLEFWKRHPEEYLQPGEKF